MTSITLPWIEEFRLATIRFTLISRHDVCFSGTESIGGLLRDRFGAALKHAVCPFPNGSCADMCACPLPCAYHILFAAQRDPADHVGDDPVRPYMFQPSLTPLSRVPAGRAFEFSLTLVGVGVDYWRFVVAAIRRMAERGLGEQGAVWQLVSAVQLAAPSLNSSNVPDVPLKGDVIEGAGYDGVLLYDGLKDCFIDCLAPESLHDIMQRTLALQNSPLHVRFLSPTRSKVIKWTEPLLFAPSLVRSITRRWLSLCRDCCGHLRDAEVNEAALANSVKETVSSEMLTGDWIEWRRVSARRTQTIRNSGFVGVYRLTGDLGILAPLLAIGERIHLGKGAITGYGRILCEPVAD